MLVASARRSARRLASGRGPARLPERGCRLSCQVSRPHGAAEPLRVEGLSAGVAFSGFWDAAVTFPKRRPFATNIIVATVKTSLADFIVQRAEGKRNIDWNRNAVFTGFGFAYLGIVQWFIYVTVFTRLCPNANRFANLPWKDKLKDRGGQLDLVKQTCYDNFIHSPFMYFPVFYTMKEVMQGDGSMDTGLVERGLTKYWRNCVSDNLHIWLLWVPGDLFVYAAPIWLRLPLNHGISLAWTMILSNLRGSEK